MKVKLNRLYLKFYYRAVSYFPLWKKDKRWQRHSKIFERISKRENIFCFFRRCNYLSRDNDDRTYERTDYIHNNVLYANKGLHRILYSIILRFLDCFFLEFIVNFSFFQPRYFLKFNTVTPFNLSCWFNLLQRAWLLFLSYAEYDWFPNDETLPDLTNRCLYFFYLTTYRLKSQNWVEIWK